MVAEMPSVSDGALFQGCEVCRLLGIHRNTLHKWRKAGKVKFSIRRADNRPVYSGREIKRLWQAVY